MPQRKKRKDNPVSEVLFGICPESGLEKTVGVEGLIDAYPRYSLLVHSDMENMTIKHSSYNENNLHEGMFTISEASVFDTFDEALAVFNRNWEDISKKVKYSKEEILKPSEQEKKSALSGLF